MNTEVTGKMIDKEMPDVLVLAVGAAPIVPPIPGIDDSKVVPADRISDKEIVIGPKVVILGGGLVGCESAVHLAEKGRDVMVVEMMEGIAMDANVRQRPILMERLALLNIKMETNMRGIEVTSAGLVCLDETGNKRLFEADTIVIAAGSYPLRDVVAGLLDAAPEVVQIGDCVKPQKVTEALYRGYHAGLDI
jgi:pyruvate/2-oxoglutarate dehydrogenase complex dihydrolipoamide dehydrogenase (E3) component